MFDIHDHIAEISNASIQALVKPSFVFFENTPYYQLSNLPSFEGAGVYALFLKSTRNTCYDQHLFAMHPIYVGKAVPSGARQGKQKSGGKPLKNRLQKHLRSIEQVENLDAHLFVCRFMIFQGLATDMIGIMESYLIRHYQPLWNAYIDGFGINAPGAGRYHQSPSEWDTLHPGRDYVKKLTGKTRDINIILEKIASYHSQISKSIENEFD